MAENQEPNAAKEPSERRIEPMPSWEATGWRWILVLVLVSVGGMFWIAMRESSPPDARFILDALANIGVGATLAFFAYRALVRFAFRILDLIGIVMVLSFGMKLTIDSMTLLAMNSIIWEGSHTDSDKFSSVVLSCLLTATVLMAGAALGLRYCTRLKIEQPLRRLGAIAVGMLSFPALVGVPVFTLAVLGEAVSILSQTERMDSGPEPTAEFYPINLVFWVLSIGVTAANAVLFLRTMAITTSVETKDQPGGAQA